MLPPLALLYREWENWAATADKAEDGWQSDFPAWDRLMAEASALMTQPPHSLDDLRYLEACWIISEEGQELSSVAERQIDACWDVLEFLAASPHQDARWQVYAVLGAGGSRAEPILRRGIEDTSAYCRRRALLSLSRLRPGDAERLAMRFMGDDDPYMRLASVDLIRLSPDSDFVRRARDVLASDSEAFVRSAANEL